MKKLFAFALCLTALLILCTLTASAVVNKDGHYTEEAKKIDEIKAGQAGEGDVAWEVPFLHISPKLDGTIDKNEYLPFELYEDYLPWRGRLHRGGFHNLLRGYPGRCHQALLGLGRHLPLSGL